MKVEVDCTYNQITVQDEVNEDQKVLIEVVTENGWTELHICFDQDPAHPIRIIGPNNDKDGSAHDIAVHILHDKNGMMQPLSCCSV